ncbi:MAG: outer membrane beta-barrel protein [Opitutaceae bacterium]|nr:outer membrane beta-barrel protein [Opitutaceae bacterium]
MKPNLRLAVVPLLLGAVCAAAPFKLIGNGAELFLTGSAALRADDNIFLTKDGESDLVFEITPGAELTFGHNSQLKGSLKLKEQFLNYSDHDELNTNLFSGVFGSSFDDGKLKLRLGLRFDELNQNSFDVRPTLAGRTPGLVRRDIFAVNADGEMELTPLLSLGTGVSYTSDKYKRDGFSNVRGLTVPIDFYRKYTAKSDLSFGYRYRDTQVTRGLDSTEHFFNLGARGEFTPKLSGRVAVGLNRRTLSRGGSDNQLGLDAAFAYELTPKASLELAATNDFATSPQGQSIRNSTLRAQVLARVAVEWSLIGGVSWRAIDYGPRTDDYYEVQAAAAYVVNANIRVLGGFVHRNYSSSALFAEFRNNVFSLSADFRY